MVDIPIDVPERIEYIHDIVVFERCFLHALDDVELIDVCDIRRHERERVRLTTCKRLRDAVGQIIEPLCRFENALFHLGRKALGAV